MFDLMKDLDRYKGIPPYASEHYGVYQPLLGWQSSLTKKWIRYGALAPDPALLTIFNGRLQPGPKEVLGDEAEVMLANPLASAHGVSPYKVILAKDLNSLLLREMLPSVEYWVQSHEGKLPEGVQWNTLFNLDAFDDPQTGLLLKLNNRLRVELYDTLRRNGGYPDGRALREDVRSKLLAAMQYESQVATFLIGYAEGQAGRDPNELGKLFKVVEARPLSDVFAPRDPLANIDPRDRSGVLAPVGFVHLFRQYFFDLGTFLGEPVEHVWLAPGTTIELIEISTRKTVVERTLEEASEMTSKEEESSSVKDELSDAVKSENNASTKLGVTTTNTVKFGVYEGTATGSFGIENSRKDAREATHKETREQTEKFASEIKRSYKSVFKTVTETTDTRSRRYVLQNPGPDLVNYELRRKMRRVGVQLQDIGTRLCWQVFVDDPGQALGLAELVHFAPSPDLSQLKEPDIPPPPANISKKVTLPIPFSPILSYDDNGPGSIYEWRYIETAATQYQGKHLGNRANTNDEDAQDNQVIMGPFSFKIDPPQPNYQLTNDIRILGPQGAKLAVVRGFPLNVAADGSFDLVMQQLNFGGERSIGLDVELVFEPTAAARADYEVKKKKALENFDAAKVQLLKKTLQEDVRQRIVDANNIARRPSWDLRDEERTVVYRNLIRRLMQDSWNLPDSEGNRRLSHVRSEMVRSIFDVDAMLYFVAPEWWMPRRHRTKHAYDPTAEIEDTPIKLTDDDGVRWGDVEKRPDNYNITEKSNPARLGSSLGWLLQLDGDNLRNAFLNAPWVKAVIPIRPGREAAALKWLRAIEGHEEDGWDTPYVAGGGEDEAVVAELVAEGYEAPTIGQVLGKIAEKLAKQNGDIANTLEADKVFEHGFDPLAGGFDAGLPANRIFSQWITILPTDQIVAQNYVPTDLLNP